MKKIFIFLAVIMMTACSGKANNSKEQEQTQDTIPTEKPLVFGDLVDRNTCFIVIDKPALHLSVFEDQQGDTVLLARYPVCVGKNYG